MSDWNHYQTWLCHESETDIFLDLSRMNISADAVARLTPDLESSLHAMAQLESGSIANPDENRMVGHYWLRAPNLAPSAQISAAIVQCRQTIEALAMDVQEGRTCSSGGAPFSDFLCIGIGGSALGPQFVADALGGHQLRPHFLDNTDPDGMTRVLDLLGERLDRTLVLVISKSGGTAETRNGMLMVVAAMAERGLDYAKHFIAITGVGSQLDQRAEREAWLARLPMWDWVGGRTSQLSAVGLLPAALQGIDLEALLNGAAAMDRATRNQDLMQNPAILLALAWYHVGDGQGNKAMVVLPYRDRLVLLSRYLQQLVMESLGKLHDLSGARVEQGLVVYGNKGSTDQHAYVQQLRDGRHDFFATFIEVLSASQTDWFEVEPGVTSGDYLSGFLHGTRAALSEAGRASLTITLPKIDALRLGAVIALFERAVGLYASLIDVNAYHQPGVEAGKRAANQRLSLQQQLIGVLTSTPQSISTLAKELDASEESIYQLARHLAANGHRVNYQGNWSEPQALLLSKAAS